ncbi:MAG TPA: co-chaperone GroES [Candidatus Limnocylindria bacterium]|nr:co-chaperone GroES [Candidatus Limnocylindria bacterium]
MKVKPLGDRVLVKQLSSEEVTKSGIVLPDSAEKEKKAQGKIVELGNGSAIATLGLKIGDTVVFGKYAGEEVEMDEEGKKVEYKILYVGKEKDDSDILALVE